LLLPPDYTGDVPAGYTAVRSKTYNTFAAVRSILASSSEEDEHKGDALVKQIKIYPLAKAGSPAAQRFVDMTEIMYDGLVHYDERLYTSLAKTCRCWACSFHLGSRRARISSRMARPSRS
jgi:hypothetical protein